ncbi:MAG: hypothetical protein ACKO13_00040 [Cytophagales bacterium]
MTSFLLKILDLFRPIFEWQKIDFKQVRAIVSVKLEMDNRRQISFNTSQQNEAYASFIFALFIFFIMGGLFSFIIASVPSIVFSYSIYHSFLIVMITLTLIGDYSSVLLDTSDNTIILPRPVAAKTVYWARTAHIFLYVGQVGAALALAPIVVSFVVNGSIVGFVTVFTTVLSTIFSIAITNGLYLVIMRFFSEEKLKSIINYFQIGMTMLMIGAYQILPRILGIEDLEKVATELKWWAIFLPPMWMAGTIDYFARFHASVLNISAVVLAIGVPLTAWKLIDKYLLPIFSSKITDLGTTTLADVPKNKNSILKKDFLKVLFSRTGLERAGFEFTSLILSRDRKFKLRVYPSLGSFAIIFAVILLTELKNQPLLDALHGLTATKIHLVLIYCTNLVMITLCVEIHFSDEHKASWIFHSAPIQKPGIFLSGSLKSIIVRFFIPIYAIVCLIVLIFWHEKAIIDLLLGGATTWLLTLTMCVIGDKSFPFSLPITARNQSSGIVRVIVAMILVGLVAGGHYLISSFQWAVCTAIGLSTVGCFFLHRLYENATWDDIT